MKLLSPGAAAAGTYFFAWFLQEPELVNHPSGYTGDERVLTVTVCIDPAKPNADAMETSLRNVLTTFNRLQHASPNTLAGELNDIPASFVDFETVALHEVGHCIGLGHPNAGTESLRPPFPPGGDADYTKATPGDDDEWDLDPGADGVEGSCDDLRDDDGNLHWFHRETNDPFLLDAIVDSTTYSVDLGDLPQGPGDCSGAGSGPHSFAAKAGREVAVLLGVAGTEAVMHQLTFFDEDQRRLQADDVATLRYAMSGIDEQAGTADDYVAQLVYGGQRTEGCDVVAGFDLRNGVFASCFAEGVFVGPAGSQHASTTTGSITFDSGFNWHFNQTLECSLDVDGDGETRALTDGLLALRFLFDFEGDDLVAGALGAGATRTDPAAIESYLEGCRFPMLDADGNAASNALSDGVLILRYLFGFREAELVSEAVEGDCTRCLAPAIEPVLASFLP